MIFSIVHEFDNYDGVFDDKDVYSSRGLGRSNTTKSREGAIFPSSGSVDRIVTLCSGVSQQEKKRVVGACKTKKTFCLLLFDEL